MPRARPEPPPTTVMKSVPRTMPPMRWGRNVAAKTGKTWALEFSWISPSGMVWPMACRAATSSAVMQWPRMYRPIKIQAMPMGGMSRALSRAPFRAVLSLLADQMAWA